MQQYTVCFLLSQSGKEVLLLKKDHTDFAGKYNGVGGKCEKDEAPYNCALREIEEETGAEVSGTLKWLGTLTIPMDCGVHDPEGCTLFFYSAKVEKSEVNQQEGESEQLCWFPVSEVVSAPPTDGRFAGSGDLQYFVKVAVDGYV